MTLLSAEVFERAGLAAWPGIEVEWDGSWVRRSANGYTKRANSAQCFDPSDDADIEQRIAATIDWFENRNLRPVFRITPLSSPALATALDAANWQSIDASHQFAMPLRAAEPDAETRIVSLDDPVFLATQQTLQNYSYTSMSGLRALLDAMAVPATGLVVFRDGQPVASALMAIADSIAITGNVITDATRRRQGLGTALMRTGHAWAIANGATIAALNVQADNEPGKALYRALGYTRQYDYSYRIPGVS